MYANDDNLTFGVLEAIWLYECVFLLFQHGTLIVEILGGMSSGRFSGA